MSNSEHPECYGTMFPSVLHIPEDRPAAGTMFTVVLERAGGMWRSNRTVTANTEQWDECQKGGDFDGCYKLSMAKLALESAIQKH
jgi:hypothetical protein